MALDMEALAANYKPIDLKPKKKDPKNFWLDQISTAGGILGGIAGLPLGVLGAAGGSAIGSGLGEGIENFIAGDDPTKNVLQEAVLGGVLGAGPLRLGGAVLGKVAPRAGKAVEQAGKNLLGSQANLTRAEVRKLGTTPAETMGTINQQTGLTNINHMADVGRNVTGESGVLSELTRNAIGNTKGVDISDLQKLADDLLVNKAPSVTGSVRKNLKEQVKNNVVKAYGGSKGSLSTNADPFGAFDVARSFEANAARLRTLPTPTAADKELADVYGSLSREINRRLFNSPGVAEGVAMARPQAAASFRQLAQQAPTKTERRAYEKLAQQAEQLTDVAGVRSAQAPYVQLGKINDASAAAQSGAAAQFGDNLQGLGRIVQRPTNMVALPLNAATPQVGGALTNIGRNLQGGGSPVTAKGLAARVGLGGTASSLLGQGIEPQGSLEDALMQMPSESVGASYGTEDPIAGQAAEQSPYTRDNLTQDIQRDPKNADKYISYFQALQEVYAPPEQPKLSSATAGAITDMYKGIQTLQDLQDLVSSGDYAGGVVQGNIRQFNPFDTQFKQQQALIDASRQIVGKALEGGVLRKEDEEKYRKILPTLQDAPEVAASKVDYIKNVIANNLQAYSGLVSNGSPLEDALLSYGTQ